MPTSTKLLLCFATVAFVPVVLASCTDDGKAKPKGTSNELAAEELTRGISFEGGELVTGLVPPGTTSSVSVVPLSSDPLQPGDDTLLGFEIAPSDADVVDALVQFGESKSHFEVKESAFASGDDAGVGGADAGVKARRHVGLVYKVASGVCKKLCDRRYELEVTQALRTGSKKITKHAKGHVTLDCTSDGDHAVCGEADEREAAASVGDADAQVGGSPDAGRNPGATGDGGTKLTPEQVAAGACSSGSQCTGMAEYSACVQTKCDAQYRMCMGDNYKQGDYTGSPCETFLTCVTESSDPCTNSCVQDEVCQSCFSNVGTCASSCISLLDCSGVTGMDASITLPEGGIPNIDTTKTCKDLETCCATLSGASQTQCQTTLTQFQSAGGDVACAAAYSSFCP